MLYLILDNIARKRGVFWGLVLLNAVALMAVGAACFVSGFNRYNEKAVDEVLSQGIYQSGLVGWLKNDEGTEMSEEETLELFHAIRDTEEVAAIGAYRYSAAESPYWTPMIQAYNKLQGSEVSEQRYMRFLILNDTLVGFCGLEVAEGLSFEEAEEILEDYTYVVYIGADLSEIPVGSVYELENKDGQVYYSYYVAGRLKEDSYWVEERLGSDEGDFMRSYDKVCLDNIFVELSSRIVGWAAYFSPAPGFTLEDAEAAVNRVSKQYGYPAVTEVVADMIYDRDSFNREIIAYSSGIAIIVMITSVTIMVCMHLSAFVLRSREYGVLYANGYQRKNLIAIAVGENLIRGAVSLFFAAAPLYFFICQLSIYDWSDAKRKIFWSSTVPLMTLAMLFVTLLCSLVPIVTFLKKRPAELLENGF